MILRMLCGFAAVVALGVGAHAQQPQDAMIYASLRPFACNPQGNGTGIGDVSIINLENMIDGPLPDPLYITKTTFWFDGIYPFINGVDPSTATQASLGNVVALLDPQSGYLKSAEGGFGQFLYPYFLKIVGKRTLGPGTPIDGDYQPANPIRYSAGDSIWIAPECIAAPGKQPKRLIGHFLLVNVLYNGNLSDITPYPGPRIKFNNLGAENGAPASTRNKFPGPAAAATKVRARISLPCIPNGEFQICRQNSIPQKVSVCVQSGSTSSCTAAPVELKFGTFSGYPLTPRQWVWSDWADLPVAAGQNVLISADYFNPGNVGNTWAYLSPGGFDAWTGSGPSASTVAIGGTVNSYAGVTATADWVQYR